MGPKIRYSEGRGMCPGHPLYKTLNCGNLLTSNECLRWHSSNDEFYDVSAMFDDGDGVGMKHTLRAVAIDLKKLITNLGNKSVKMIMVFSLSLSLTLSLPSLSAAPPSAILSTHSCELYSAPPLMLNPNPPPLRWISM